MRRPNLFLVGAAKAGTTALFHLLDQHPAIDMCRNKEPHFFGADVDVPAWVRGPATLEGYLARSSAGPDVAWVGDASPSYLPSHDAPDEVRRFSPDARVVVVLRDPVEACTSLHGHYVRAGLEWRADPAAAWAAARGSARPVLFPRKPWDVADYPRWVSWGAQVARWIEVIGRDRVLVVLNDDLRTDPQRVLDAAWRLLGLPSVPVTAGLRANEYRTVASPVAQRLVTLARTAPGMPGRARSSLARIQRRGSRPARRPPASADLAREIRAYLRDDLAQLSDVVGLELAHWQAEEPA